jgi:DNA-directed RNA polymerase specialized sigma24 family protein
LTLEHEEELALAVDPGSCAHGFSHREAGQILDAADRTVATHVNEARATLSRIARRTEKEEP